METDPREPLGLKILAIVYLVSGIGWMAIWLAAMLGLVSLNVK